MARSVEEWQKYALSLELKILDLHRAIASMCLRHDAHAIAANFSSCG